LGPGAFVITLVAPVVAQLIQRQLVSTRTLLAIGLAIGGATMWYYGQNNRASSLTNLSRNWGGSVGIAFMTTITERREQFHQSNLGSGLAASSQQLNSRLTELTNCLVRHRVHRPRRFGSSERLFVSPTPEPGDIVIFHGLLPCNRMADIGHCRAALARPAVQASGKAAIGALMGTGADDEPAGA
jgi:hypothetical protein